MGLLRQSCQVGPVGCGVQILDHTAAPGLTVPATWTCTMLTPAFVLNSSPHIWDGVSLPGFFPLVAMACVRLNDINELAR